MHQPTRKPSRAVHATRYRLNNTSLVRVKGAPRKSLAPTQIPGKPTVFTQRGQDRGPSMGEYRGLPRNLGGGEAFSRCSLNANERRVIQSVPRRVYRS